MVIVIYLCVILCSVTQSAGAKLYNRHSSDAVVFNTVKAPNITGVYDEATENAVREVQRISGLEETGNTDLLTWTAVGELYNDIRSGQIVNPEQYPGYIID